MLKETTNFASFFINKTCFVGCVFECLKCCACDQHGLGSKHTRAILLCPLERYFTAISLLGSLSKQF